MIYIGIDVAKDKHDCHIFDSDGVIHHDSFVFDNSRAGFNKLLEIIKSFDDKTKVGLEATGHYSENLLSFLTGNGLEVVVFNPLSVNRLRTAGTLRKTKTDKNDARYIARLLVGDSHPYSPQSYHTLQLKSLTRARFRLIKEIQPLKNRFRRLVHIVFPELETLFSKLDSPSILQMLAAYPSAKQIAGCDIRKLSSLLSKFSHGKIGRTKAEKLKTLAENSIGSGNSGDALELSLVAKRIIFFDRQKDVLEAEIATIMQALNSPITTIPGIGTVLGAVILAEIGNINSFASDAKLLAFAGCEPSTYQSGKYTAANTPMVKHGSRYLRNALYLAANMAYLHNPVFKDYIDKKRAEGKHFYVAMSHGMKKLVRIIFAVLTKNTPYAVSN